MSAIGAALFVSIGGPLTKAGPLGLLIGIAIWSMSVWAGSNCLVEIATLLPVDGGFVTYANRYVEKSFSMALGWNVRPVESPLLASALELTLVYSLWWRSSLWSALN